MKFINSKEESHKSMIGKIYQNKKYAGNYQDQIVGLTYDPKRDMFLYIIKPLHETHKLHKIEHFKKNYK